MPLSRSEMMARVKGRNTAPERLLRSALWRLGHRYRLHKRIGDVRPDIVFVGKRVAVFVDGCFWHGCPQHYSEPKTNTAFWQKKVRMNMERDESQTRHLEDRGWTVVRVWEHEVTHDPFDAAKRISEILNSQSLSGHP